MLKPKYADQVTMDSMLLEQSFMPPPLADHIMQLAAGTQAGFDLAN